jgi:hypothetical protein
LNTKVRLCDNSSRHVHIQEDEESLINNTWRLYPPLSG